MNASKFAMTACTLTLIGVLSALPNTVVGSGGILGNDPHYSPVGVDGSLVTCHRVPVGSCVNALGLAATPIGAQVVSFHNDCGVTPQPLGCPGVGGPGVAYLVTATVAGGVAPTNMFYWQCVAAGQAPIPGSIAGVLIFGGLFTGVPGSDALGASTTQGSINGANSYSAVPNVAPYLGDWAKTPGVPAPGTLLLNWFPQPGPFGCAYPCFPVGGPCLGLPPPQHTDVF